MKATPIVLLATADTCLRDACAAMLSHLGLRVEHADSGEQAFLKAAHLLPDVIVAHLALPDMDGGELRDRLRVHRRTHMIPILVVTGSTRTWLDAMALAGNVVALRRAPVVPIGGAPPLVLN